MKLGFVGLPNVGKTTIFNALTGLSAESSNYPYSTVEANLAAVEVPDARLDALAAMFSPKKVTPATANFVDIAGLAKGASRGEGLGNRFLAHIREVDAILHVIRCFDDPNVVHVEAGIDPVRDRDTINIELCMADLEVVEKRIQRVEKAAKGDKSLLREAELFTELKNHLDSGLTANSFACSEEDRELIADCPLLTLKPVLYCANLSEDDFKGRDSFAPYLNLVEAAKEEGAAVFPICATLEQEIIRMDPEDRALFLEDLGMTQSGRDRLIQISYDLMGLMSFLTAGTPEVRAWTIHKGTKAPQAAGKIHKDLQRGFIRAEVVAYDALMACGSMNAAKEKGLVRSEGKEYVMRDGDIVLFRFNV
ncbi:MAG: redox-regulated ATPase YchF [Oscillospiraceae bacterium]|jgi:GTP-binding protein YchF|nr:redox-regulated ATPase YchF [Oscillospiraceae bacterium]